MTITLQKRTAELIGILEKFAHRDAPGLTGDDKPHAARLAQAGYAVFVPGMFNMPGFPGDNHYGLGRGQQVPAHA